MTAQKGNLLLKVDSDGEGNFTRGSGPIARLQRGDGRHHRQESAERWRELLEGAGIKTARISAAVSSRTPPPTRRSGEYFFASTVRDWQLIVRDLGAVEGPFQIATLEYDGQHDGGVDLRVEATGALSFTPAS